MKTEYEYIRFAEQPYRPGSKTKAWGCWNNRHHTLLGLVQWDGAWRQYVFWPSDRTQFSAGCLADIQDFIEQAMKERR